jgi:hypothetical protein
MLRACLVTALALAVPSVAVADTTMTLDVKAGSLVSTDTIYVSPAGYRYETAHAVSIFRPQDQVLFDITPAQHSYFRVTSERLRQAAATFDASRHDWGDKLNAMSSERRQHLEAALGPATTNSASPLVFTPTEYTATYGNRHCQMLHVMLDHVQHGSVCVVPLSEVGLDDADAQVLKQLTRFMMQGPHPTVGFASFWDLSAIEAAIGKPAFSIETIMAVPSGWFEFTVHTAERRAAPADAFVLPPGLTEETAPPHPG